MKSVDGCARDKVFSGVGEFECGDQAELSGLRGMEMTEVGTEAKESSQMMYRGTNKEVNRECIVRG